MTSRRATDSIADIDRGLRDAWVVGAVAGASSTNDEGVETLSRVEELEESCWDL